MLASISANRCRQLLVAVDVEGEDAAAAADMVLVGREALT